DPGGLLEPADQLLVDGLLAALGPHRDHLGGPLGMEDRVVEVDDLLTEAGRGGDHGDPGVGATRGRHELLEDPTLAELVLRAADDHEWSPGHAPHPRTSSGAGRVRATLSGVKTLVVIRHGKAEQSGPSDFERQLTDRGVVDATEAGQWLAGRGV